MMTLEEVITTAKEVSENQSVYVECKEEHKQLLKQLTDWLEELKALREKSRWIPCSERLPKKPECGENGYIVQKKHVAEPFSTYWDGARWTNEDDDVVDRVIAWMPLPEPYKEDEDAVN